jgi:ATP-dependent Clp protease protease subunit
MATTNNLPLPKERNLYFTKQVDQASIGELTKSIIEINDDDDHLKKLYSVYDVEYDPKPIKIFLDSYGGAVYQCFGLLSVIERSKTPIHTIVTGCAMSCGFMILICGHRRFAHKLSTPLYHQVSSGVSGTVTEIEDKLEESKRLQKQLEDIVKDKTKITKKRLREILDTKKDWYMTSKEAQELGVIDEILD